MHSNIYTNTTLILQLGIADDDSEDGKKKKKKDKKKKDKKKSKLEKKLEAAKMKMDEEKEENKDGDDDDDDDVVIEEMDEKAMRKAEKAAKKARKAEKEAKKLSKLQGKSGSDEDDKAADTKDDGEKKDEVFYGAPDDHVWTDSSHAIKDAEKNKKDDGPDTSVSIYDITPYILFFYAYIMSYITHLLLHISYSNS